MGWPPAWIMMAVVVIAVSVVVSIGSNIPHHVYLVDDPATTPTTFEGCVHQAVDAYVNRLSQPATDAATVFGHVLQAELVLCDRQFPEMTAR